MGRRILIILLFSASGIAALLYQFVWIRMLSHLLGGTSLAISSVLAVFMGGLALGSRFFGHRGDSVRRPLRLYAWLEVGIGVLGALVPVLILAIPPLYVWLARSLPAAIPLVRILVAVVLLLPPTFLMGGTLPVLSRFVVRNADRLGRSLGILYAANTAGAVLGAFLAGFVLVEALGLLACTALAVAVNLVIALAVFVVDRGEGDAPPVAASPPTAASPRAAQPAPGSQPSELGGRALALAFGLSGFAALGYEIHWTRALQHFLGNSTYAFSAMLTTFLLGLSGGGWVGGWLADRVSERARWLGWVQVGVGLAVAATVPLIWNVLPRLAGEAFLTPTGVDWNTFLLRRFLIAFLVISPPTFLIGMTFPIVNRIGVREMSRLGHGVGTLYFANTVGAILGSLAAGFLVLPLLGPKGGILATACLSAAIGVGIHFARKRRPVAKTGRDHARFERQLAAGLLAVLILIAVPLERSGRGIYADTQESGDQVLFDAEDPIAATRVYEKPNGDRHIAVDGHRIGGSAIGMLRKEQVLAHLPLLLVPKAERVLAVGMGSGITLGSLSMYEEIRSLTCVEIVPSVRKGAEFFDRFNQNVFQDPRLTVEIEDGVQFLLTTRDRFDIISSDSKINPHYVGNAPLLALDYYELCRDRLTDDGVMVQWLPLHLPESIMRMVTRSFVDAFPHSAVFWHYPYNVIQVGSRSPITMDMDRARAFAANERLASELASLQLENPEATASLFVTSDEALRAALGEGAINTWMRPQLEFQVIRDHLTRSIPAHEDANLRWLLAARQRDAVRLRGDYDQDTLQRFVDSSGKLLQGYAAGGGTAQVLTGRLAFEEGLKRNPADWRLRHLLDALNRSRGGGPGS